MEILLLVFCSLQEDLFEGLWKRMDLRSEEISAAEALERICRASGESLKFPPVAAEKKISLNLEGATFWQAVDEVCRRHDGLNHPARPQNERGRKLDAAPWSERPTWYGGPLRLFAYDAARVRSFRYPDRADRTEIALVLQWTSRFVPVTGAANRPGDLRLTRAEDDTGNSLLPLLELGPEFRHSDAGMLGPAAQLWLYRLRPAAATAKRVAVVEGEWEGTLLEDIESVTFEKPAESVGESRKAGPITVTLVSLEARRSSEDSGVYFDYSIRLSFDPESAPKEWQETLKAAPLSVRALSKVDLGGGDSDYLPSGTPEEGGAAVYAGSFGTRRRAPDAMTFHVAKLARRVKAPFVLHDIRLPEGR